MTDRIPTIAEAFRITVFDSVVVRFHEVDAYNIVHNVNYFNFFDIGRFNLVDRFLRREKPPEIGQFLFLVLKADCKFLAPARMADELTVETEFVFDPGQRGARVFMRHSIVRPRDRRQLVEGTTTLGICDRQYALLYRMPDEVGAYCVEQIKRHQAVPQPGVRLSRIRKGARDGVKVGG